MQEEIERPPKREEKPIVIRNTTDLQRLKLEKLMKNPDKQIVIPERPKGRAMPAVPDFVRNVMGSSAGAGSGEFHVYRHLRRKEYARQKFIQEKSEKERLNDEYHQKLEDNRLAQQEKTAKKRAKRLKRKLKAKQRGKKPKVENEKEESESESSEQSDNAEIEEDQKDDKATENKILESNLNKVDVLDSKSLEIKLDVVADDKNLEVNEDISKNTKETDESNLNQKDVVDSKVLETKLGVVEDDKLSEASQDVNKNLENTIETDEIKLNKTGVLDSKNLEIRLEAVEDDKTLEAENKMDTTDDNLKK